MSNHYREFLQRYARSARQRRPGFSLGAWAKALGLKSTSSLTKVLNGQREAGPDLVERFIRYFKFDEREESQFRKLVTLSKLKEDEELQSSLMVSLLLQKEPAALNSRLVEFDQFELLESPWHLAIREMTRVPQMKVVKLLKHFPELSENTIERSLNLLARMKLVKRGPRGEFIASDMNVHTTAEVPSEAIRNYHRANIDLAKERLDSVDIESRDYQSLLFLVEAARIPEVKEKLRGFLDSLELTTPQRNVDRLYQVQFQLFPVSAPFKSERSEVLVKNNFLQSFALRSLFLLSIIAFSSCRAEAEGGRVGNGGGLIVCKVPHTKRVQIELLDFYEARTLRGWALDLESFHGTWQERAQGMVDRLAILSPMRGEIYREWLRTFASELQILRGVEFSKIPDSLHVAVPKGCEFEQGAIQVRPRFSGDHRYLLNGDLWDQMPESQRAGLVLHELLYREAIFYGHTDSLSVRYLTGLLSSPRFLSLDQAGYLKAFQEAHFEMTDVPFDSFPIEVEMNLIPFWSRGPDDKVILLTLKNRIPVLLGRCSGEGCENFQEESLPGSLPPHFGIDFKFHPLAEGLKWGSASAHSTGSNFEHPGPAGFEWRLTSGGMPERLTRFPFLQTTRFSPFTFFSPTASSPVREGIFTDISFDKTTADGGGMTYFTGQNIHSANMNAWSSGCASFHGEFSVLNPDLISSLGMDGESQPDIDPADGSPCKNSSRKTMIEAATPDAKVTLVLSPDADRYRNWISFHEQRGFYIGGGVLRMVTFPNAKYSCLASDEAHGCMQKNMDWDLPSKDETIAGLLINDVVYVDLGLHGTFPVRNQTLDLYPSGIPRSLVLSEFTRIPGNPDSRILDKGTRVEFSETGEILKITPPSGGSAVL